MKVRFITWIWFQKGLQSTCWEKKMVLFPQSPQKAILIFFMVSFPKSRTDAQNWMDQLRFWFELNTGFLTSQTYGWNMFNQFVFPRRRRDRSRSRSESRRRSRHGKNLGFVMPWWNFRTWAYLQRFSTANYTWFWYHNPPLQLTCQGSLGFKLWRA